MMTTEDDIVRTKNRTLVLLKELGPARPGLGGKDLEGMVSLILPVLGFFRIYDDSVLANKC